MRFSLGLIRPRLPYFFIPLAFFYLSPLAAQTDSPLEWVFHPDYRLGGKAENYPGPRVALPQAQSEIAAPLAPALTLRGKSPTERLINFCDPADLPAGDFSVELWMVNHVNQPIGTAVARRGKTGNHDIHWMLGYFGNTVFFGIRTEDSSEVRWLEAKIDRGWKKYWLQVVASVTDQAVRLYFNGSLKATFETDPGAVPESGSELELMGYFGQEPYMEISNLVKRLRLYDRALSPSEIDDNRRRYQQEVEQGALFPELFHFTAGPYLHYVTDSSINISWETDRRLETATLYYGESVPLTKKKALAITMHPIPPMKMITGTVGKGRATWATGGFAPSSRSMKNTE